MIQLTTAEDKEKRLYNPALITAVGARADASATIHDIATGEVTSEPVAVVRPYILLAGDADETEVLEPMAHIVTLMAIWADRYRGFYFNHDGRIPVSVAMVEGPAGLFTPKWMYT